jgi:hypothetical protein
MGSTGSESRAEREKRYLAYLVDAIRVAARKPPQFGTGKDVSLDQFKRLYGDDPFYAWIGFDSDLLYTAHRAGSAMTSLYRKLGDGCQELWRSIIRDQFGVEDKDATWEYTVPTDRGPRKRTLDGRIDVLDFPTSPVLRGFQKDWLPAAKKKLGAKINPRGVVFEVRQGYKSQDAKRAGGDVDNAGRIALESNLPSLVVFSNQIPEQIARRYATAGWLILRGTSGTDPLTSTFAFAKDVMGFDLAALLERNSTQLRRETEAILSGVLRA